MRLQEFFPLVTNLKSLLRLFTTEPSSRPSPSGRRGRRKAERHSSAASLHASPIHRSFWERIACRAVAEQRREAKVTLSALTLAVAIGFPATNSPAQEPAFSSATISGSGARKIV